VPLTLPAQLIVSRNFWPLTVVDTTPAGFLTRIDFHGEAQRGFGSAESELAWDVKIAGVLELYRWNRSTSVVAFAGHELTANPFNSIGFNPRGAIWEETLFLVWRGSGFDWHVGLFHRCRHEIDNSHPPDESAIDPSYEPTARLLSLTGVHAGLASTEKSLGSRTVLRWFVRAEGYATTTDNREPRNTVAPFWKDALGATAAGARLARDIGSTQQLYARAWASIMLFSGGPDESGIDGETQWRGEIGYRATGRGGGVDLFIAYEQTFDDVSRPVPQRSQVFGVGIRFAPQ
jgi:hypothetical protein